MIVELWKWCVLLQAEKLGAKIILDMPNFKWNIAWKIYKDTRVRQYKMFIGEICISITDEESEYNIKNINNAFLKNKFLQDNFK